MLEFVLFFFGMPLAITLLYNYCETQKKRKARLKRIEQEHIRESELAQLAERQRERERQREQLVREQIELAKQRALESIEHQREEEEARRAAQEAKEMKRAQKEAEKAAKREHERQQAEADLEYLDGLRAGYMNLLDALEEEMNASTTSDKRRLTLRRQMLNTEEKLHRLDTRMAKAYFTANLAKEAC